MKKLSSFILFITFCWLSFAYASTCPDKAQLSACIGRTQGSNCDGWLIYNGIITPENNFLQILSMNSFPFGVTCQYNGGQLSLVQSVHIAPNAPYLWSRQYMSGLLFHVCVSSLTDCSFTIIG